jgi:hypothetical protein
MLDLHRDPTYTPNSGVWNTFYACEHNTWRCAAFLGDDESHPRKGGNIVPNKET